MKSVLCAFATRVIARPLTAVLLALVFVAGAGAGLAGLTFDNRPDAFFLKGDTSVETWRTFKRKYASDEFSFVVLTPEHPDQAFVETLRELTYALGELDGAERVTSLVNVRSIRDADGVLDVGDYLHDGLSPDEVAERLAAAPEHPHYGGLHISRDGRHYGIVVETDATLSNDAKATLTAAMRTLLASADYADLSPMVIGAPVLDSDVQAIVGAESGMFGALTLALVLAGLALAFRSWLGLALPVAIALPSIVSTLGFMGHFGATAGLLTPIIPSFLISVGLGSAVYLLTEFHRLRRAGTENREAILKTVEEVGVPAVLACLTTAGALFAFSSSRVLPVQHVGLALGAGLLIALALTLILFPAFATWLGGRISQQTHHVEPAENRFLARICRIVVPRPHAVVGGFLILVLIGIAGFVQLRTDYYYLGTFKTDTPIYRDYTDANDAIPVSNSIEVVVRTGEKNAFQSPAALRGLDQLADEARAATGGTLPFKSYALSDVVKEISQATLGSYSIPDERSTIAQLLLLFESSGSDELTRLTTPNYDEARLTVLVPSRPYSAYQPAVDTIASRGPALFAAAGLNDVEIDVTGVVPLWMRLSSFLTETQISSFIVAAVVVTLVMVLVFRSLKLGLAMAGTNLGCVLIVTGAMGWLGITLDPFTILIGAIAIGILDDDTMHFVLSALERRRQGERPEDAVRATYQGAGRAMGIQTLVLVTAFLVYTLSSVASLTLFGVITAATILLGLLAEYLVTPAVFLVLSAQRSPGENYDAGFTKRSEEPHISGT